MTYSDFIDRVNDKVRTEDEWPESGSATDEQVHLSWIAALAVASVIPLSAFSEADFANAALTGASEVISGLDKYSMPSTVFRYREDDLGINSVFLDGKEYQIDEAVPLITIRNKASNGFYKEAKMFSADISDRFIYALNVTEVKLNHLTAFSKPATGDISTTNYPFEGTHAERAASIVAGHVLGELKRDMAGAQFQAIMQNQYNSGSRAAAQPETEA